MQTFTTHTVHVLDTVPATYKRFDLLTDRKETFIWCTVRWERRSVANAEGRCRVNKKIGNIYCHNFRVFGLFAIIPKLKKLILIKLRKPCP